VLWDQTIPGNPPFGYEIGSVYEAEDINKLLGVMSTELMGENESRSFREATFTSQIGMDTSGHGTAVLGIMAGNGNASENNIIGVAPEAEIIALHKVYTESTADEFVLEEYDYIVDAIDSIADKMLLILRACETDAVFFSSMGAARKLDSSRIGVSEFWKVKGCPLGASLRRKFRAQGTFPKRKFQCVYSDEQPQGDICLGLGSMHHITSVFGITIAGLVVRDICLRE
jgi:hypothetical protein